MRTDAAKRHKRVANATALIWKVLMLAQSRLIYAKFNKIEERADG